MQRVKVLILTAGAVAIASLATACGSNSATGTTTTTTAPASTSAAAASASPAGGKAAAADCLQSHGVSQGALSAVLGGIGMTASAAPTAMATATVSSQTLRSAGIACQSALPATSAATLAKLDTCVAGHGISTAHTGSPLADILLLNLNDTSVHSAMSACLSEQGITR